MRWVVENDNAQNAMVKEKLKNFAKDATEEARSSSEHKTKRRPSMQIKCPHCEEMCETDFEPEIGQRILCPFYGEKFGYSPCDISTSNAPRSDMCGSRLDPLSHFEENSSSDILEPISVVHGNESRKTDGNKNRLKK